MGYQTNFEGKLNIDKKLSLDDYQWLIKWNDDRHEDLEQKLSYYCQWKPTEDGLHLEWDGNEKFYAYVEWLEYLIKEFFQPKGYILNGKIDWEGEENDDIGKIIVKDNKIEIKKGKIVFE
jgi:hypothetical protein